MGTSRSNWDISRRDFLKVSSAATVKISLAPTSIPGSSKARVHNLGDVVLSRNECAAPDLETVNANVIQEVVNNGILKFTSDRNFGDAYQHVPAKNGWRA